MTISLPDVNCWITLAAEGHVHHVSARDWFTLQLEGSIAFCRVTHMSLLRLLTNRSAMGAGVRTIQQALETYSALRMSHRVVMVQEPVGMEAQWATLMQRLGVGPSSWTDAYLAAFAYESGYTLVTFDRGFTRWTEVKCHLLVGEAEG